MTEDERAALLAVAAEIEHLYEVKQPDNSVLQVDIMAAMDWASRIRDAAGDTS